MLKGGDVAANLSNFELINSMEQSPM